MPDIDTRINNHLRLGVVRMNIDQMNSKLVIEWQSKEHQDQVKQRMEPLCTFKMRKREDKEQDNRALSPIFVMTKVRLCYRRARQQWSNDSQCLLCRSGPQKV